MTASALQIRDLSYSVDTVPLLRDISFSLEKGAFLSIIGPNGAGKTTIVKCINRILRPDSGSIELNDEDINSFTQRELARYISYIPQSDVNFSGFTVYEFVMMGRYPHFRPFSAPSEHDQKEVSAAMQNLGIDRFAKRLMTTLSGGERQKVLIAAALVQSSNLLLLDEPTTFLDSAKEAEIARILREVNKTKHSTIISVTHDLNVAIQQSSDVLLLNKGEIMFFGRPSELLQKTVLDDVFETSFLRINHPNGSLPVLIPEHHQ